MRPRMPLSLWRPPPWPGIPGPGPHSGPLPEGELEASTDERGPIILLYHSIGSTRSDPFGIRVSPRNFAEQMAVLQAHTSPARLDRIEEIVALERPPRRPVIVTFDDGYLDNLTRAVPILERHKVPATIFVASGYVDSQREYWWEDLARIFLRPGRRPESLALELEGQQHEWSFDGNAAYSVLKAFRNRRWKIWQPSPTRRHEVFHLVWKLLKQSSTEERESALEALRVWAGVPAAGRARRRCVTHEQLRALAARQLIEIGAHTITHPCLAAIDAQAQRREIAGSKTALESLLDRPVASFAYPFGTRDDYTNQTATIVKEAGFARCCSNFAGAITPQSDFFQLPRRVVLDWTGREFADRLAGWFASAPAA